MLGGPSPVAPILVRMVRGVAGVNIGPIWIEEK